MSPYREPQRAISVMHLKASGAGPLPAFPGVSFSLGPYGESFGLPTLSLGGAIYGVGFFGIPGGPLDFLHGRIRPIVRDAVGALGSGAHVLGMGDTAVTNGPVGGQGANMAAHSAKVYQQAILEHGDKPFGEEFLHRTFATF